MVLERLFGGSKKIKFRCKFKECGSRCCRNNLVVLGENDIKRFNEQGISLEEVTAAIELNQFLKFLGSTTMPQLEGLNVLSVKKDQSGNCVFLDTSTGCCKIYSIRPYPCREFPFRIAKFKITNQDASCIGLSKGEEMSFDELAEYIGIKGMEKEPPYLVGERSKIEMANRLMSIMFKVMR